MGNKSKENIKHSSPNDKTPASAGVIAVKVDDLTVAYNYKPVLWDIDLEIPEGVLMAIVGPNGAGKSTLIKAILGILKPIAGSVTIYDKPYDKQRQLVAYVPQKGSVDWDFPTIALDVVMMGTYGSLGWIKRPKQKEKKAALTIPRAAFTGSIRDGQLYVIKETKAELRKVEIGETFGDQIDPRRGFIYQTGDLPRGRLLENGWGTKGFIDLSAGIVGYSENFYFGFAAKHLNTPEENEMLLMLCESDIGGTLKRIKVAAGEFETCLLEDDGLSLYLAKVPFGYIKIDSIDEKIELLGFSY